MINEKSLEFSLYEIKRWHDIGEPSALRESREAIPASIDVLDKATENIYILEDSVVKFFHDPETNRKRIQRSKVLKGLVPKIIGAKDNFFRYEYAEGDLFSKTVNPASMKKFLIWCQENMWSKTNQKNISDECDKFYFEKTEKRALQFLKGRKDKPVKINGQVVPGVEKLIRQSRQKHDEVRYFCYFSW